MRTLVLVLLILVDSIVVGPWAKGASGRLGQIRPGMSETDVLIEVGKPIDIRVENDKVLWIYPSSESELCSIHFDKHKVAPEGVTCDSSPAVKEMAAQSVFLLPKMNSDLEHQGRVDRYCGVKPKPKAGCQISLLCSNGAWEEVCK